MWEVNKSTINYIHNITTREREHEHEYIDARIQRIYVKKFIYFIIFIIFYLLYLLCCVVISHYSITRLF